jgi:hypothetical protein
LRASAVPCAVTQLRRPTHAWDGKAGAAEAGQVQQQAREPSRSGDYICKGPVGGRGENARWRVIVQNVAARQNGGDGNQVQATAV